MTFFISPLLALAVTACGLHNKALWQDSWQQKDPGTLAAWTPPPEYALRTIGHKTMYLADVAIGASGQTFRLLVDTGSSLVVLPGAGISKRTHRFDASAARPANRTISVQFGLGAISGHVFEDRICMADSSAPLTEVGFLQKRSQSHSEVAGASADGGTCAHVSFVVADHESDDFADEPFDGILGLGPQSSKDATSGAGFSFLAQLVQSGATRSTAFALRLSQGSSRLLLGGVDESSLAHGQAVWVPLSPEADGYWQFSVQDLTLDGRAQQFGSLQVAVDSGTSLLAADDDLKDWFREHLLPKDCHDVDNLPKLGLRIGSSILSLLPADYIDQEDGKCSLALMPSKLQSVGGQRLILGDSFMRRYTTIFDSENSRLGFGVSADDEMAKELLPAMFPRATTTMAPSTSEGPPPPMHLDYSQEQFVIVTTPSPPTVAELEAKRKQADLSNAFSGLGDDLADSFEKTISNEKKGLGASGGPIDVTKRLNEAAPAAADLHDQSASDDYLSYLKFLQLGQINSRGFGSG